MWMGRCRCWVKALSVPQSQRHGGNRNGGIIARFPGQRQSLALLKRSPMSSSSSLSSIETSDVTKSMEQDAQREFDILCEFYEAKEKEDEVQVLPRMLSSPADAAAFLAEKEIHTVLFDCDGVLYRSPHPAPGAKACLRTLIHGHQNHAMQVFFVTNNSAANPAQLRDKISTILGFNANDDKDIVLTQDMMISTAFTSAQYLKQQLLTSTTTTTTTTAAAAAKTSTPTTPKPCLYVIGSSGLQEEIRNTGFDLVNDNHMPELEKTSMSRDELAAFDFDSLGEVDAVVVGHDTDFSFRKLCLANVLLQRNPDALLVATNVDSFDLVGADGRHLPGNGSLVKALEYCSGRTAVVCGKPSALLADLMSDLYQLDVQRTLFVGDRLDTDIQFAKNTGMLAALVLTGVTTAQTLQTLGNGTSEEPLPDVIMPHVGYLAGESRTNE